MSFRLKKSFMISSSNIISGAKIIMHMI